MTLEVLRAGSGPRVVLVHGSMIGGERTWRHQLELAERWSLVIPNRPGFGASPPLERGDFEAEAPLIAELLEDGAHLVGHSYGGVIALMAAGLRPEAVRSLTISEPGCLNVAAGDPVVDATIANGNELYRRAGEMSPRQFVLFFRSGLSSAHETPEELPDWLERGARHVMAERPPWEADVPFGVLAAAPFPKLVISGDHSAAFERMCDVLAERMGARREVLPLHGHTIPSSGEPYNRLLEQFLSGLSGSTQDADLQSPP
jgi:pimeloyl-ACP methyl ester carboxylesterase